MPLSPAMTTAASTDDVDTVRRLLDAGHDVNARNDAGETAFSFACANNALRVAQLLHARGADINTPDAAGGSPLDWAVCWSSPAFRTWLKSIGARRHVDTYPEWPWPPPNDSASPNPSIS